VAAAELAGTGDCSAKARIVAGEHLDGIREEVVAAALEVAADTTVTAAGVNLDWKSY
jgi:hypothetical protein